MVLRCGLALQSGPNRCETFFANLFTCSSKVRPLSLSKINKSAKLAKIIKIYGIHDFASPNQHGCKNFMIYLFNDFSS